MRLNERTLKMMDRFLDHRTEGKTVAEIATAYALNPATVYRHLDEIAERNGVDRDELLDKVGSGRGRALVRDFTPVRPVEDNLGERIATTLNEMAEVLASMDYSIAEHSAVGEQNEEGTANE